MQIDKIQAKIRPRTNWEAVDLGFLMTNKWKANIYKVWFIVTMPFFLLFNVIFHHEMSYFILAFWLFIPIYDRFILLVVSRRLFDEKITLLDVIRAAPRLTFKHIFKHLTFYRFDPARSFNLPVWFLENLSGSKRSARARILKISASGTASTLTTACSILILFFYLSILATLISFIPGYNLVGNIFRDSFENIVALYQSENWYVQLFANSLFYVAISLVEPFYVCAGFALYLNRRTELESWDIELSFKSLRNRLEEKNKKFEMAGVKNTATKLVALLIISSFIVLPSIISTSKAYANINEESNTEQQASLTEGSSGSDQENIAKKNDDTKDQGGSCRTPVYENGVRRSFDCIDWKEKLNKTPQNRAEKEIRKLLSEEKYKKCSVVTKFERIQDKNKADSFWKKIWDYFFKNNDDDKDEDKKDKTDEISFANIFEVFLWGLIGVAILYLLIQLYKYRDGLIEFFNPANVDDNEIPTEIFGLDITPESIPEQLSDEVLKLWELGEHVKALSLLYRGCLSKLVHDFGVDIRASYTENDCLTAAKNTMVRKSGIIDLFSQITNLWLMIAYAHRTPKASAIIDCCRLWRMNFEATSLNREVSDV